MSNFLYLTFHELLCFTRVWSGIIINWLLHFQWQTMFSRLWITNQFRKLWFLSLICFLFTWGATTGKPIGIGINVLKATSSQANKAIREQSLHTKVLLKECQLWKIHQCESRKIGWNRSDYHLHVCKHYLKNGKKWRMIVRVTTWLDMHTAWILMIPLVGIDPRNDFFGWNLH